MRLNFVKFLLCYAIATVFVQSAFAQECKDYYEKAEMFMKKKQYEKALRYYTDCRDCGDANYRNKSIVMIENVNQIIKERKAVRSLAKNNEQPYIIVPSVIYLPSGTEEQAVNVESSGDWNIKVASSSVIVKKSSSSVLKVSSVSSNPSTTPRKGLITIECGEIVRVIEVEQDGIPEILEYKSKYMNIPYEGGIFAVDLNTNTKWNVDYSDWYKAYPDTSNNARLFIEIDRNIRNEDRNGTIIIRSESGVLYDKLEIHQFANESRIFSPVDSIIQFKSVTDTIYVPVISDNPTWTESDRPSWCMAKKMSADSLMIIVNENENYFPREGFVNIKSNDKVAGIWIRQSASNLPDYMSRKILGGKNVSLGLSAGFVIPDVHSSSSGTYTGSVINYSLCNSNENVNYSSEYGFSLSAVLDLRVYKNWYIKTGVDYMCYKYTNSFNADVKRMYNQVLNTVYVGTFQNSFKEEYAFDIISIPLLASYRFVFDNINNLQVDFGSVANIALSAKMDFTGNSNSDNVYPHTIIYNELGPVSGNRSSEYMKYSGEVDLLGTKITSTTTSSLGGMSKDYLNGMDLQAAPYKRVSWGLRLGVVYEFAGLQFGVSYTKMLTNMANERFWESGRLPIFGNPGNVLMAGYKHKTDFLEFKVGYILRY